MRAVGVGSRGKYMRTKFFDLPLRFQIIIPFSALIIALAVAAVGFGLPLANKSASESVDLKLDNAHSLFLLLLDNETSELDRSAALLAQEAETRRERGEALRGGDVPRTREADPALLQQLRALGYLEPESEEPGA